jgi:peptide/nickel transport system permease protein
MSALTPSAGPFPEVPRARRARWFGRLGPLGVLAALVFLLIVIAAAAAPLVAPYGPNYQDLLSAYSGPSGAHPLGTDELGRDLLSRLIWAARPSLLGPLIVVLMSTALGVSLAIVSAWRGGIVDTLIGRAFDICFAFPAILLAVLVVSLYGPGLVPCAIALGIAYTPWIGRITRSAAIRERSQVYIAAGEIQGISAVAMCFRHLLPNIRSIIIAQATINFGYALVDLAALSFLGLGTQPPNADLGQMVNAQGAILRGHPAEAIYAGILIVLCVTSLTYIGDRISDETVRGRL